MQEVVLPPELLKFPRKPLLFPFPSPIEKLSRLSEHVRKERKSDCPELWIKREDCNSGLALGGNKLRKLEYVIADAIASGCDTIVTVGGIQSNHMRQTVAAANKYGLSTCLLPADMVPDRGPEYYSLGNVQICHLFGATVRQPGMSMDQVAEELRVAGKKPYTIPPGSSLHPLGGLGFAHCAFEIIAQEKGMNVFFDTIVLTTASGSTIAGLVAGFTRASEMGERQEDRKIVGIDVMGTDELAQQQQVQSIVDLTTAHIGSTSKPPADFWRIDKRFNAGSYGHVDAATKDSIKLLALHEGILTDPVYTGKAFNGLITMATAGELTGSKNVLFLHTGGQAAISAYESLR